MAGLPLHSAVYDLQKQVADLEQALVNRDRAIHQLQRALRTYRVAVDKCRFICRDEVLQDMKKRMRETK